MRRRLDPFYSSAAWHQFRRAIRMARPVCQTPGCGAPSSHVDHIVPRRAGGASLDPANVQALCAACHNRKTATRDGAYGNSVRPNAVMRLPGCDANGVPRDPAHPWAR